MLTLNQLTAIAEQGEVAVQTVERDYVLTHLIQRLSTIEGSEKLTLKGGTALRLVHFATFRYSADIDLNVNDPDVITEQDALELIAEAARWTQADLGLSIRVEEEKLTYTGPRNQAKPENVKLDIATDELATSAPYTGPLVIRYADQTETRSLPSYDLEETAAEKLRCVVQRLQCRDLYDIHRLLVDEGVDVVAVWQQFTEKAAHRGIDPDKFTERWPTRIDEYRKRWETEMPRYTKVVPQFDRVLREIERALRPLSMT
jgi:predicted nucleotidyltransferase component of viral defense system